MKSPRARAALITALLALLSLATGGAPSSGATLTTARDRSALAKDTVKLAELKAAADARTSGSSATATATVAGPVSTQSFPGLYDLRWTPSDSTGAIGTTRYLEVINTKFGLFDRSGNRVAKGGLGDLTPGISDFCSGDPQAIWDPDTSRFYVTNTDFCTGRIGLAWSKTASPSSANDFCSSIVDFGFKKTAFVDYQKLGDTSDFLLVGMNVFQGQVHADVGWVPKPPAGAGCLDLSDGKKGVLGPLEHPDGTPAFTPVPANGIDPSGTGYVMASADPYSYKRPNFLTIWKIRKSSTGRAELFGRTSVDVPAYGVPSAAREPGTNSRIDTLDTRLWEVIAAIDPRFGKLALWTSHAVFGGAGSEARWYEIDPSAPALLQSGSVSDPNLWIFNPSISSDRAVNGSASRFGSNMVLNVSTSSLSDYPAIQMLSKRGRADESPLVLVKQSPGFIRDYTCPNCRWGDYSSATPDPAPAATATRGVVWMANQWNVASATRFDNDWRTWIWAAQP
jgi:hypothetical protein